MAPSSTLLGPLLGGIVGAFGAIVAAVIGAFVAARLNRPNTLAERHIGDAENQRNLNSVNRPNLQGRPSAVVANGVRGGRRRSRSV
ncbi:hypothetical protein GGR58DRAFT_482207 [Xylaria digitata]|nr:hypothetical protein GGR58DRAFT_482207 [Xylaria digitata]